MDPLFNCHFKKKIKEAIKGCPQKTHTKNQDAHAAKDRRARARAAPTTSGPTPRLSNLHRCNMRPPTGRGSPGPDPLLRLRRARLPVPQGDDARSFTEQGCLSWWPEKGHADKRAKRPRQGRQARHIPIEHQVGLHPRRQVQRGRPPLRPTRSWSSTAAPRTAACGHGRQARGPELHGPHAHAPPPLHAQALILTKKIKKREKAIK